MKSKDKELLKDVEAIALLVISMMGVGFLSAPNLVTQHAKQDALIAIIIGTMYPVVMVIIAYYLSKLHPTEDILDINRIYFGKYLGRALNVLLLIDVLAGLLTISSTFIFVLRTNIIPFLTPVKVAIPYIIIMTFLSKEDISTIKRSNVMIMYLLLFLSMFFVGGLSEFDYKNFMPVFSAGISNIIKDSINFAYAYNGIEIIFLLYPKFKNKEKILSIGLKAIFIASTFYLWNVFTTMGYLGYSFCKKSLWSIIIAIESVKIPFLNEMRILFIPLVTVIILRRSANEYYAMSIIVEKTFNKASEKLFYIIIFTLILYASSNMTFIEIKTILNKYHLLLTSIIIIYTFFLCCFLFIKNIHKK